MRPVTLVVCFIPFLSTPSLGLVWDSSKFRKHITTQHFWRSLQAFKDVCVEASVLSQQPGRTAVACAGSWKAATPLPLFGFLCCRKHRRQQPTLLLVLGSNYGGDYFSFKSYHPCTHQSKCLQTPQSPNPLVSFCSYLPTVRSTSLWKVSG